MQYSVKVQVEMLTEILVISKMHVYGKIFFQL